MATASETRRMACVFRPLEQVEAELVVLPWFEGEQASLFESLDRATAGEMTRALASGEFAARPFEVFVTPIIDRTWRAGRVALIGAGKESAFSTGVARRLATTIALVARQRRVSSLGFVLRPGQAAPSGDFDLAGFAQAVAEGMVLADFDGTSYQTSSPPRGPAPAYAVVFLPLRDTSPESSTRLEGAVQRGVVLGEASNLARELANEPGNTLTPSAFAERAVAVATSGGATAEVLDERQIDALHMGMLAGVSRGSSEPPRLMVFRHEPPGAAQRPILGLVGKGVTFDTGGISIKPAEGMEKMKDDMAGGAAVACAMHALARLNAPIRVVGVVPATENMPGGRAVKPGDVLKSAEGKTVEVINTDAEGRLILGDGLWYARQLGATHLVDVATLTGAIVVALGKTTTGLFGTPDWWVEQVKKVADRAGDRVWQMPLFDDYRENLKSEIADMMNTGGRPAGSINAAMFLKEFTGGLPWAHLDVAGTAWADEGKPWMPKGPTGVAVRTLVELAFTSDRWK